VAALLRADGRGHAAAHRGRPPITIDHVRFPTPITIRRMSLHDLPGSDHRALIAELVLPAAGTAR